MIDQFGYAHSVVLAKSGFPFESITAVFPDFDFFKQARVMISSYLLSYIPIFSLSSVTSLAFVNKLLILFLFPFLARRLKEVHIIYFFLIPSLILYSSVSIRDTLILVAGVISIIYLIEKKTWKSLLFIVLVGLTKIQNLPALLVLWIFIFIFDASKSYLRLAIVGTILIVAVGVFFDTFSGILNLYRAAFAVEDGLPLGLVSSLEIINFYELIVFTLTELPLFLIKPLPWEVQNVLQMMVFLESLILVYLLYLFGFKGGLFKRKENILFLYGLIICMGLYSLTVFNFGTLARYRFVGFFPFLIGFFYLKNLNDVKKKVASA